MHDTYTHSVEIESYRLKVCTCSNSAGWEPPKIYRSKEDSEHITGLKVEITLLKTFIKESYNNLMTLRRAEQTEADTRYQHMSRDDSHTVVLNPYGDGSTFPSDVTGVSNAFEPPVTLSPSPTSNASGSDNEDSNSDGEAGDGDIDQEEPGPKGDDPDTDGLKSGPSSKPRFSYDDFGGPSIHRESNLLLQMVPYRLGGPERIASDRLISDGQGPDSGTKSATEEATNSVRLLLDKWTTSGSAPVSNILDEEAAREKDEALVGGPSLVIGLADINSPVSWTISVELQTHNSIGTDGRRH